MPIRSLNYTGRRRLTRNEAHIGLREEPDGRITFDADIQFKGGHALPPDAQVFVEAYRGSSATWMRFAFGTVGKFQPPRDRRLTEFDSPEGILFRVKVTSFSGQHGLLLAEADKINPRAPEEQDTRESLLPVRSDPNLEDLIFRLDFSDKPVLLVNSKLGGDKYDVVKDKTFMALVLPSALEAILVHILLIDKHREASGFNDEIIDWHTHWLHFARALVGSVDPPDIDDEDAVYDWIGNVVSAFCRKHRMLDRFDEHLNRGDT